MSANSARVLIWAARPAPRRVFLAGRFLVPLLALLIPPNAPLLLAVEEEVGVGVVGAEEEVVLQSLPQMWFLPAEHIRKVR